MRNLFLTAILVFLAFLLTSCISGEDHQEITIKNETQDVVFISSSEFTKISLGPNSTYTSGFKCENSWLTAELNGKSKTFLALCLDSDNVIVINSSIF